MREESCQADNGTNLGPDLTRQDGLSQQVKKTEVSKGIKDLNKILISGGSQLGIGSRKKKCRDHKMRQRQLFNLLFDLKGNAY